MKTHRIKCILVLFPVIAFIGCSPDLSIDWGDVWNTKQYCYTVKDAETNQSIAGASIGLIGYNNPDCLSCPINLGESTNSDGKACLTLVEGWWCKSSSISAQGYISKTFNGKPPTTIYLTPIPN